MRILLMLPMMNLGRLWGKLRRGAGNNNFSYGLASIAAYLRHHGYEVEILDPQFLEGPEALLAHFRRRRYDVIGISSYTPTITEALETARLCRRALPEATIILGGPHCTYFPEQTLRECEAADYVIPREGEETTLQLLRSLEPGGPDEDDILGLTYRDGGTVRSNPPRPFLDVDRLPTPAYDLFPLERYSLQPTVYKRLPTLTTLVSRGCPFQCTFCHGFEILGRKVRYRDVSLVADELQRLVTDYGARGFMFHDSTFTIRQDWVTAFCEEIMRRRLDVTWMCLTRTDCLSPELLRLMRRAGCYGLSLGIESANQKSLDLLRKNTTVGQNEAAIRMCLEAGLYVTATYMIGLPGEDERDVRRTVAFAHRHPTHIAHFFWPVPYPHTVFYDQCEADGGLKANHRWEDFNIYAEEPVYVNPRIGLERMRALQRRAIRSYYTHPKVLRMNLRSIDSWTDLWKYAKAGLALTGMAL